VATSAIRDEGTSYHYLPPDSEVACKSPLVPLLEHELIGTGWPVRSGKVWTTDAPYRETKAQLNKWIREGVLAVEMQAASLFAFGIARQASWPRLPWSAMPSIMRERNSIPAHKRMASESSRGSLEQPDLFSLVRELSNVGSYK